MQVVDDACRAEDADRWRRSGCEGLGGTGRGGRGDQRTGDGACLLRPCLPVHLPQHGCSQLCCSASSLGCRHTPAPPCPAPPQPRLASLLSRLRFCSCFLTLGLTSPLPHHHLLPPLLVYTISRLSSSFLQPSALTARLPWLSSSPSPSLHRPAESASSIVGSS